MPLLKEHGTNYDGTAGCMDTALEIFFDKYKKQILKQMENQVQNIDADMAYESFSQTAESAGSLDG